MNKSTSIKSIAAALAKFQAECGTISKTANNPFFKSKYAPLSEILEQISTPLKNSGLVFSQFPDGDSLTTILMHSESGEWMEASYNMHPAKSDPQSVGSAISYARRYALGAILALNIDDDDDGAAGSDPVKSDPVKSDIPAKPWLNKGTPEFAKAKEFVSKATDKAAALKALRVNAAISKETESLLLA